MKTLHETTRRPTIFIEVDGGIAEYHIIVPGADIYLVDYDNLGESPEDVIDDAKETLEALYDLAPDHRAVKRLGKEVADARDQLDED